MIRELLDWAMSRLMRCYVATHPELQGQVHLHCLFGKVREVVYEIDDIQFPLHGLSGEQIKAIWELESDEEMIVFFAAGQIMSQN